MKKIGLLGGTFDPIHLGHLNLAVEIQEKKQLDEIWFMPTPINPLKQVSIPTSFEHRFKMIQLAIQFFPGFYVRDDEKWSTAPFYTYKLLQHLFAQQKFQAVLSQFYLILGEDILPQLSHWYRIEDIIKQVPFLIGSRSTKEDYNKSLFDSDLWRAIEAGYTQTTLLDISSTDIRERLKLKKSCYHLLPSTVIDYIQQNQLYQTNKRVC